MRGAAPRIGLAAAGAVLLAGAAAAEGGARDEFILRFDLLSPPSLSCSADAPGAQVRSGRDPFGKPMLRILGDARNAVITCADPQGVRWSATANRTARYDFAGPTYGTVLYRPGRAAMATLVEAGDHDDIQLKSFVRVD